MSQPTRLRRLALALAWTAGFVDAVGYLVLIQIFVAHQSGNTITLGVDIGRHHWLDVLRHGVPIPLFVVGVGLGALILDAAVARGMHRTTSVTLVLEASLLLCFTIAGSTVYRDGELRPPERWEFYGLVATLVIAMGVQSATLRRVGGAQVRTTFVTGMLTHFAEDVAKLLSSPRRNGNRQGDGGSGGGDGEDAREQRRAYARKARLQGGIWCVYLAGGILGALAELAWALWALFVPLAVLAIIIGIDQIAPWHAPSEDTPHGTPSGQ